jgi:PKD repeat protein
MKAKLHLFGYLLLSWFAAYSQNENTKWYFGYQAALDFMTNPPTVIPGSGMSATEGCSSIANAAGVLQFYTDGVDVYNSQNTIIANGSPPLTGGGNKQGTLIVKQPGNNSLYYIFVASFTGLRYSIVDMSLAAGAGSITVKNVLLTANTQAYKVAGTLHCNKTDVWVVSQDENTNTSRAYLLTAAGLSAPVLSTTGAIHTVYAALKFSPDGSKLASTEWGDGVRLYDFNTSTGIVSNLQQIAGQGYAAWGLEFSPDGSKLYAARGPFFLLQWDLTAGSTAAISASQYTVFNTSAGSPAANFLHGALQLAPDGKIYAARSNMTFLSVINNPNIAGSGCNFAFTGPSIAPKMCNYGLPNSVKPGPPLPAVVVTASSGCNVLSFAIQNTTVSGVSSQTYSSLSWNFGDPGSGGSNSSSSVAPSHQFTGPGIYTVQLTLNYACGGTSTVSQTLTLSDAIPLLSVSGNMTLCMGQTGVLSANGASSYAWSSPSGPLGAGASAVITPSASGIYTVSGMATNTACVANGTIGVTVIPTSTFTVSGNFSICQSQTATLSALGAASYSWMAGSGLLSTSPSVMLTPGISTSYTVMASTNNTCLSSQVISIAVEPNPTLSISGNLVICEGQTTILYASGAATYSWIASGGTITPGGGYVSTPLTSSSYTLVGASASGNCVTNSIFNITVDRCVGIAENNRTSDPLVFPNPSKGLVVLTVKSDSEVRIFDLKGAMIVQSSIGAGVHLIDISEQPDGVYVIKITDKSASKTCKLIKQSD